MSIPPSPHAHDIEQDVLTARYEVLSPAGKKLHDDHGYHLDDILMDADGQLMKVMGMAKYDEWRADLKDDELEEAQVEVGRLMNLLSEATGLLKEIAELERDDDGDVIFGADDTGRNRLMERIEIFVGGEKAVPFLDVVLEVRDPDGSIATYSVADCTVLCGRAGSMDYTDPLALLPYGEKTPVYFADAHIIDSRNDATIDFDQIDWETPE